MSKTLRNVLRLTFFLENGAFNYDKVTGLYSVNLEKMKKAVSDLSGLIIKIQGDGDYQKANDLIASKGFMPKQLISALDRVAKAGIPRDIVFEQGPEVLGL